ncbi:uncharacterized protein LOC119683922 [Teleopsis dalmanni]|uniref:uncharacterized protein LOC119683699 n=1 Tax=Teleopsis dalmanni TaxID=139649 RepID=UPI0018CCE8C8|nr:uncharacterized protein LOC119683699 [Teleopsis dalmanni]XP_037953739.1 uncharacterized protein LOC119683922 [Teleopsis dalmanni]
MSLRAIKKRENQLNSSAAIKPKTFSKNFNNLPVCSKTKNTKPSKHNATVNSSSATLSSVHSLRKQHILLGRAIHSTPDLQQTTELYRLVAASAHLVRTKSAGDVDKLITNYTGNLTDTTGGGLTNAKSEICLQTISSHSYTTTHDTNSISSQRQKQGNMISGARSHRDLTQSAYVHSSNDMMTVPHRRRMSECSYNSSGMSSSALTLSSNNTDQPNSVVRVPIIGYEVMEERARFTVYKLRVENPHTNDCWLVLRRYTDFVRLNTKLKQAFPNVTLMLPRKKIFGDNFNSVFLDNRVQGLQMFVNSIMAKDELRKFKMVREFFCLDEPPTYSESMEECRAIFEAQEETIAHLKLQINNKNDLILSLQQKLQEEMAEKEQLRGALKNVSLNCSQCSSTKIPIK